MATGTKSKDKRTVVAEQNASRPRRQSNPNKRPTNINMKRSLGILKALNEEIIRQAR